MYCYEGTNITREKAVNHPKMKLNEALIESHKNVIEASLIEPPFGLLGTPFGRAYFFLYNTIYSGL